jgi:hypothetical protein
MHTWFLHKAHLANLVLQDCVVNGNGKVKLLMCFLHLCLETGRMIADEMC